MLAFAAATWIASSLPSDRSQSAVGGAAPESESFPAWRRPAASGVLQPRLLAAIALIVGGCLWACARGLHFYGIGPVDLVYDLDQPPVLLVLVGIWLCYRSRRR